jgi:hypothetical protein
MKTIPDELEVLKIVTKRLEEAGIGYMITGSVAANFYSQPRMTRDVDIVIQVKVEQIDKLYHLFKKDFYIDKNSVEKAVKEKNRFNIIHNEKIIKIDFIISKETEHGQIEFSRKIKERIDDFNLFIVSPEDLILSKLAWAKESSSETQLRDVKNIILFNKESLDYDYLKKWSKKLSVEESLEEVIK